MEDGTVFHFYRSKQNKVSPLHLIPDFDEGNYYSIDACGRDFLEGRFLPDNKDDSFVLIPKSEIKKVFVK